MTKVFLLTLLLTVVYSWEEIKRSSRLALYGLLKKQKPEYFYNNHLDQYVSTIILLAVIPITFSYLLSNSENTTKTLFWIMVELIIVGLIVNGVGIFLKRIKYLNEYDGMYKFLGLGYSLLGLISPLGRTVSSLAVLDKNILSKSALSLTLPPVVGLMLKWLINHTGINAIFIFHLDQLIIIVVIGLFILTTIVFLKKYFWKFNLNLSGLFRILLGILIMTILIIVK